MAIPAQRVQLGPFTEDGAILGGALLYHYEAGTDTLKDIWSDASQTVTLAQPFESDASGVFNFFADGYYKIVIKKADGTDLYTLDNWKMVDLTEQSLSFGSAVPTASSMSLGDSTAAHWSGSTNVTTLSGTAVFYWAIADGNFTLVHSASLVLPGSRNRKVLAGDVLLFVNEGAGVYRLAGHAQTEGGWVGRQGAGFASSSTLALPTDGDFVQVSGSTNISAVATAAAGYKFRAMFTGTGLNIIHSSNLGSPWGVDYHTIQNEIIDFLSLGSGSWAFWSLNGPKEQTGQVISWHSSTPPVGALALDGSTFSSSTYPGLFARLGTTTLPDDRGRNEIVVDGSANRVTSASTGGANADTLGGTGGAQTHTLAESEIPAHVHGQGFDGVGTAAGGAAAGSYGNETNTTSTGGGGAHNNMTPWIARYRYIRF